MMNGQELKRIIEQVSRDRGIDKDTLISTLEEAIKSAAKRKYGVSDNIEASYNEESGEIEVFRFKEVVEEVVNEATQVSLIEAKKLDPESSVGEELGLKLDAKEFGRIAAQFAKQVIIQRMNDAERGVVFDDFKGRVGEIVNGIVQRVDKGNIIISLGRAEALLPVSEQIPKETYYRRADRLRALIIDAKLVSRGPQIILSRTHPDFLAALFKAEVPEIAEDIVRIVAVAREPGSRAKIAVTTSDSDVDPVGACVGLRGSRVQGVVQELKGEKVDIVPYSEDIARYVASALLPAEVSRVIVDEDSRILEVVVPDDQLSLAIGRKGQNVRLASRLLGWKIDVKNESKYQRSLKEGYQSLIRLPGIGEITADALYEAGYGSAYEVHDATLSELSLVEGIDEARAGQVKAAAVLYLEMIKEDEAEEKRNKDLLNSFMGSGDKAKAETVTEEAKAETVAEEVTEEEKAETVAEEVTEEEKAEPVAEEATEEVKAETVVEEAKAEEATEEVKAETVVEEAKAEEATEEVKAETVVEEAKAEEATEEVKAETVTEEAKTETVVEEAKAEVVTEEAKAEVVVEEAKAEVVTEEAKAEVVTEEEKTEE